MRPGAVLRAIAVVLFASFSSAAAAQSGEPAGLTDADRSQIRAVIERQMTAFRADDKAGAFALASPAIQSMFVTPEAFMNMVKSGYQPVYRPKVVEFQEIVQLDGAPVQRVYVVGPDGVPTIALYPMQRQPDGSWRINGCYLVPTDDRTT